MLGACAARDEQGQHGADRQHDGRDRQRRDDAVRERLRRGVRAARAEHRRENRHAHDAAEFADRVRGAGHLAGLRAGLRHPPVSQDHRFPVRVGDRAAGPLRRVPGTVRLSVAVEPPRKGANGFLLALSGGPGQPSVPFADSFRASLAPGAAPPPPRGARPARHRRLGRAALPGRCRRSARWTSSTRRIVERCATRSGPRAPVLLDDRLGARPRRRAQRDRRARSSS